jgi:hypothetical protein
VVRAEVQSDALEVTSLGDVPDDLVEEAPKKRAIPSKPWFVA